MGSVIPSTQIHRVRCPVGRGAWAVAWRSCWISSRRNTCPSGERQVCRERDGGQFGGSSLDPLPRMGFQKYHLHCADETSFEAGIRVQIHSQEEPPYIHQLGFGVSPGFQTFVSCQEQRVSTSSRALDRALGRVFGLRGDADRTCPPTLTARHLPPWTLLELWAVEGQVGL